MSTKNYTSIYNIKDFAVKEVAPKYFNMDKVNDLNIGLLGYTTELIGSLTEDNFNTVTMYMNEMFPHLAVLPESIYNYALLFQTDGAFATAAEMEIMLFVSEDDIINNGVRINSSDSQISTGDIYQFVLDANMVIDIEGIQFMPDYDIQIRYKYDRNSKDYIFTAAYEMERYGSTYVNSMSSISSPYIRVKRINLNGKKYLLLIAKVHRVNKFTQRENILSNAIISAPSFTVEFDGSLASFDIFYKDPSSSKYTQLIKRLSGSTPIKDPFCYYKIKDENKLEITFNTRDNYFQPEFNSELIIDHYTTTGKDGNFPLYTGNEITVVPSSDTYQYNNNIVVFAIPQTESAGGADALTLDELKNITVEKFSTVGSYTNENDLQLYFSNFKDELNADILFIKKRDDLFERLFTSFSLFKDDNNNIYHTNTVNMKINKEYKIDDDNNIIGPDETKDEMIKPGTIFRYCDGIIDTVEFKLSDGEVLNLSDESIYDIISSSESGISSKNIKGTDRTEYEFLYTNPYLIYINKNPMAVGYYINTVNDRYTVDYKYVNDSSLVQFICNSLTVKRDAIKGENSYKITMMLTPTITLSEDESNSIVKKTEDGKYVETGALKVRLYAMKNNNADYYIDMHLSEYSSSDQLYTYTGEITTSDQLTLNMSGNFLNVTNMKASSGENQDIVVESANIPMYDCVLRVDTLYKQKADSDVYVLTNTYTTDSDPVTFINPIQMIKSTSDYKPITSTSEEGNLITTGYSMQIKSVPLIRAKTMLDENMMWQFYSTLKQQYKYVNNIIDRVTNSYSIDMKFYNTYGKSKNFYIGDNADRLLDKVNIKQHIQVRPVYGKIIEEFVRDLKLYIKDYIENINDSGSNSIYISNLIQSLENDFPNLNYMKFVGINNEDSTVQVIENKTTDLSQLSKDARLNYVPEYLTIELDDIVIDII